MKKFFSFTFFILAIAVFVYEMYFSIVGAFEVDNQFTELAARGASGHEILGVGLDILVFECIFISIVGFVLAIISWKIAQYKSVRKISGILSLLFLLPFFIIAFIFKV